MLAQLGWMQHQELELLTDVVAGDGPGVTVGHGIAHGRSSRISSHSSRIFAHSLLSQVSIRETFDRSVPALARYFLASSSYGRRSRMASLKRLQRSLPNFPLRSSNNRWIRGSIFS